MGVWGGTAPLHLGRFYYIYSSSQFLTMNGHETVKITLEMLKIKASKLSAVLSLFLAPLLVPLTAMYNYAPPTKNTLPC